MFENLSEKLQRAFKNLRGQGTLNEENMQEALREIRLALLEADVNFKVVKELIDHIREKALGSEVMLQISPTEQVVKIVHDELINILGKDTAKIKFASQPPTVVLMAGLQGLRLKEIGMEIAGTQGVIRGGDDTVGAFGRGWLGARTGTIAGGSTEMSRNLVSERVLGLPR